MTLPDLFGSWLAAMGGRGVGGHGSALGDLRGRAFVPFFETGEGLRSDARLVDYMRYRLTRVKRTTLKKELSALNRLFDWMVEQKLLGTNQRFRGFRDELPVRRTPRGNARR